MGAGITNGIIPSGGGAAHRGAVTKLTSSQAITLAGAVQPVAFDAVSYDTDTFWSGASATRLTVPAGVTKVQLSGSVRWDSGTEVRTAQITMNGDDASPNPGEPMTREDIGRGEMALSTSVLEVIAGDYFELEVASSADTNLIAANTWLSIEVIE